MTDMTTDVSRTVQFRLPDLGEGVVETEIIRWLVQPGEVIAEDQPMVEVMTDKATVEIPAPAAGTIQTIHAIDGAVVAVGTVIVEIATSGDASVSSNVPVNAPVMPAPTSASAAVAAPNDSAAGGAAPRRVQATPLVRRLASELGVDLATLTGSGPAGRITEADVRAAVRHDAAPRVEPTGAASADGIVRCIPLAGMRRQIAEHLSRSQQVPVVTVVEECDLTALESARVDSGLGYIPYVARALLAGFDAVPELNATLDETRREVLVSGPVHLGIAVQARDGLLVPVLRDLASLTLADIERDVASLAAAAHSGSLQPAQLTGGTFTLTSAGKFGGLFTTPLLNLPQVGILGLHRVEDRAAVVDGAVVVRRRANLSITFDHRANDGIAASRFLLAVIDALQHPAALERG